MGCSEPHRGDDDMKEKRKSEEKRNFKREKPKKYMANTDRTYNYSYSKHSTLHFFSS